MRFGRSILVVATIAAVCAAAGVAADAARGSVSAPALELGSHGARVRTLQGRLVELHYLSRGAVNGRYGMRTWHAVVAFEGWRRLPRDGVASGRVQALLRTALVPHPWKHVRRGLLLDLERQVLLVVRDGRTTRAVHVSSAAPGYHTPTGSFHVYRRERMSWSVPYQTWMPYALYFTGGYAVHGFSSVPAYPASHGCVRMPLADAPAVYAATPLGTTVLIR